MVRGLLVDSWMNAAPLLFPIVRLAITRTYTSMVLSHSVHVEIAVRWTGLLTLPL